LISGILGIVYNVPRVCVGRIINKKFNLKTNINKITEDLNME